MNKTIVEFLNENFEELDGVTDVTEENGNMVDIWDYEEDNIIFSLKSQDEDFQVIKWHKDNKSAKSVQDYLNPTEKEMIEIVKELLKEEDVLKMEDLILNVRSQKAYDSLMVQLDEKDYQWMTDRGVLDIDLWYKEGRNMLIILKHEYDRRILYGNLEDEEYKNVVVFKPKDKLDKYLKEEEMV